MPEDGAALRALLSSPHIALVEVDLTGTITGWSEGASLLFGRQAEDALGLPLATVVPADELADPAVLPQVLERGAAPAVVEAAVPTAQDGRLQVRRYAAVLRDEQEQTVGALALYYDTRPVGSGTTGPAEQAVREHADLFEAVLETLPAAVFSYDLQTRCTFSRGQALEALGLGQNELVGVDLARAYVHLPEAVDALWRSLAGEAVKVTVELAGRRLTVDCRPQRDRTGEIIGGLGVAADVTERTQSEREVRGHEAWLRSLLQHASDVAVVVDRRGSIRYVSPSVRLQLGYAEELLADTPAVELVHPDDQSLVSGAWEAVAGASGATASCECRVRHADGSYVWTEHMYTNLLDDPTIKGVVVNVRETTERRRIDEDLRRLALQDGLTGLANRSLLLDRAQQALVRERRTESRTGLVVLDVVGMHALNRQLGQAGGDVVLREFAQRLRAVVRPTDSLARIGGDEFAVLCADVASSEDLLTRLATLLEVVDEAIMVDGWPVDIRLHVGSALSPVPDAGALLATAERSVRTAATDLEVHDADERERGDELRRAIDAGDLRLHYQPVLDLASGQISGAEALVRWQHPDRGLLSPADFIPLAERSGLVVSLGEWVLREVCTTLATWESLDRTWTIAVNLSPQQLVGVDFPAVVRETLAETGARADRLIIEVTESTLMDDSSALEVLKAVRGLGVRMALDDFGTGYSSLTYLRRFPVDAIKIDRSFVAGLGRDPDDDAIVASIVSLGRAVGKLVVAEGVETAGQLQALQELGVDRAQGFLWSRPLPLEELLTWAQGRTPLPAAAPAPRPAIPAQPAPSDVPEAVQARISALHQEGASLHTIAAALNAEGSRTPHGPRWTTTSVARVVAALGRPEVRPRTFAQAPGSHLR